MESNYEPGAESGSSEDFYAVPFDSPVRESDVRDPDSLSPFESAREQEADQLLIQAGCNIRGQLLN